MAYTKQLWADGDSSTPLSAERLTHMETMADQAVATSTANTTQALVPVNAAITKLQARISVNVDDKGAVGDGSTNDAAAIQAAYTAVKTAGGGTVHFTSGKVYRINSTIIVPGDCTTQGHGATVYSVMGSSKATFVNQSAPNQLGYGAGGRNIHFYDLTMTGDYTVVQGDCGTGWNHVENLTFNNCTFAQGMANGHYLDLGGCKNVRVINCQFLGMNPIASRSYVEAIQIDINSYISSSWKAEPTSSYDGLPTRDVVIEACYFGGITVEGTKYPAPNPAGSHSAGLTSDAGYYENIKFANNVVRGFFIPATQAVSGWLHFYSIRGLTVTGNQFYWEGTTGAGNPQTVACIYTTSVYAADQAGATSPVTTPYNRRNKGINISNNTFYGFAAGPNSGGNGIINVEYSDAVVISGNIIMGAAGGPIYVDNCGLPSITNNVIDNSGNQRAIAVSNSGRPVISNNDIQSNARGIEVVAGGTLVLTGNSVTGGTNPYILDGIDNGIVNGNFARGYSGTGFTIGTSGSGNTNFDLVVTGNRASTGSNALVINSNSTRTRRYGNLWRDGGSVIDSGVGTTTTANDQTS